MLHPIGTVGDDELYQTDMGDGFKPWRRNLDFLPSQDVPIVPFIDQLSFIRNKKSWGYVFRWGFFGIPQDDFRLIAERMTSYNIAEVVA